MLKRLALHRLIGIVLVFVGCVFLVIALTEVLVKFIVNRVFKAFFNMAVDVFR